MSQIILKAGVVLSSAMLVLSLGCSDARTPKSLINSDTGKHDAGWESPDSHGAVAKAAAGSTTGFAVCQECHADTFIGGISKVTCLNTAGCHGASVSAPHSPKPWRGGTRTHTNTDQSNAPVCALCHTNGANSSVQPSPFDSGAAPGCFNNTLCHATPGHPDGWALPSAHGTSAKSAPTSTAGFSYCQTCHGNDFTGGTALQTCLNTTGCHGAGVNAPHAASWLPGDTYTHTTTDQGNAPVCGLCHLGNRQPPAYVTLSQTVGCFDNTLCHGAEGHAAGWANPNSHGAAAKSAPTSTTGFSLCQTCHGNDFTGGTANQSCFTCHQAGTTGTPPHAFPWLPGDTYVHTTTDQGNAPECALCHLNNRTPPSYATVPAGTTPGCFNNTLCHATPTCGTCHAIPPNGAVSPNVAGQHAPHIAVSTIIVCATCHTGAGDGTTALHQNDIVDVIIDPTYNAKSGSASYNATNNTCSNVSCHGGQTTPGWLSGTVIDVNTQCTSCHGSGTTQYNGYNSGEHSLHVSSQGIACTTCHDTTLLAVNHFTSLNTTALEGPASATLRSQLQYNGTSCNPSAGGLSGCHSSHNW